MGYTVFVEVTGYAAALQMLKNETPDIVLLNTELGEKKEGTDMAVKLSEQFHQPFIFLTDNGENGFAEHFKK